MRCGGRLRDFFAPKIKLTVFESGADEVDVSDILTTDTVFNGEVVDVSEKLALCILYFEADRGGSHALESNRLWQRSPAMFF